MGNARKDDEAAAAVGADIGTDDEPPSCSEHEEADAAQDDEDVPICNEADECDSISGNAPAARIWSDVCHLERPLPPRRCEHTRSRKSSSGRLASCDSDGNEVGDGDLIGSNGGEVVDGRCTAECGCDCEAETELDALVEKINGCDIGDSPKIEVRVGSGDGEGVRHKSPPRGVNEIGRLDETASGDIDGKVGARAGASIAARAGGGGGVKIVASTVWT